MLWVPVPAGLDASVPEPGIVSEHFIRYSLKGKENQVFPRRRAYLEAQS